MTSYEGTAQHKTVFVILGMGRSGTSAIARGLQAIGVDLGGKLIAADQRNPKGFWEDADILYNVNRGISRVINYAWLNAKEAQELELKHHLAIEKYKQFAVNVLQDRFSAAQYWGFKDPRTTSLLPFWHSVFQTMHLEERYVIAMRNPLATAHSHQKFSKFDPDFGIERGLVCWLNHMVSCVDGLQGKKRLIVSFEAMLENPRLQLERMHRAFGISSPLDQHEIDIYANEFLDKKLNHNQFDVQALKSHPAVAIAPLCVEMHALLMRAATDELSLDSDEFNRAWSDMKVKYNAILPVYQFVEKLIMRNKEQQRELRKIKTSVLWQLTYPWQLLRGAIAKRRRMNKERSRLVKSNG